MGAGLRWCAAVIVVAGFADAAAAQDNMQIEQVVAGVEGSTAMQAIQLRMRHNVQGGVSSMRIRAWNAAGANPVVVVDFTTNVPNGTLGNRVLITSADFGQATSPPVAPNFQMTNLIPPSYLAAGSLTYESDAGVVAWRLSWGGSAYTGPHNGSVVNDPDGNFGPAWAGPLPSGTLQALRFLGSPFDSSSSNATDYALTSGAAVFTNNANASFTVVGFPWGACCLPDGACTGTLDPFTCEDSGGTYMGGSSDCATTSCPQPIGACCHSNGSCTQVSSTQCGNAGGEFQGNFTPCTRCAPPCPSDCAAPGDGRVNVTDLLELLAQWAAPGACNVDGDAAVDVGDLLALLAAWGLCPS